MDKTRRDGGYVLVYVVVVIVILCILVPAACSNSLQNLKAQQASVERMRQLYTAEGQIERFVAEVKDGAMNLKKGKEGGNEDAAKRAIETAFGTDSSTNAVLDKAVPVSGQSFKIIKNNGKWSENDPKNWLRYKISAVSKTENIQVETWIAIELAADINSWMEREGESQVQYYSYKITSCTITYESYDISATAGNESEEVTP